jgi:DNA primase
VYQSGFKTVVASCGTALTLRQATLLRRFTSKIVLSFDPDTAGDGAAVRSCELLVAEGFDVNVAILPVGEDPDTLVRNHGPEEYANRLRNSRPYLEYLLERSASEHDFTNAESRRHFLSNMLSVAAQIPDLTVRDQFADRLAHKARITEEVVRKEIRKAAAAKRTTITERELPQVNHATTAERALVWAMFHQSDAAGSLLETLDEPDLEGLMTRPILEVARTVHREGKTLPSGLLERVSMMEAQLATTIAAESAPPVLDLSECIRELKRLRYDREQAIVQQEIDHLQELGAAVHEDKINALWIKKRELLERIAGLV